MLENLDDKKEMTAFVAILLHEYHFMCEKLAVKFRDSPKSLKMCKSAPDVHPTLFNPDTVHQIKHTLYLEFYRTASLICREYGYRVVVDVDYQDFFIHSVSFKKFKE